MERNDEEVRNHVTRERSLLVTHDQVSDSGNGDEQSLSFEAFYVEVWPWAVRVATLISKDPAAGPDIAQDSLFAVYRRWGVIDQPKAYLRRAIVNRCQNWERGERTKREKLPLLVRRGRVDLGASELADAIDGLPVRQRAVLVLRYYCDFSEAEIAHALGCRPGTVKSLSSRALRQLRREIPR